MRLLLLICATLVFTLHSAPASAQCRAGACRAQFGRAQARRSYVYQTKPLTISEQYDLDYDRRVVPTQAQSAPPPAVQQKATAERGRVGGKVLKGGGKVVRRIGKGVAKALPPYGR